MTGRRYSISPLALLGIVATFGLLGGSLSAYFAQGDLLLGPLLPRAKEAYLEKDWPWALVLSRRQFAKTPSDPETLQLLARCEAREKNDRGALNLYQEIAAESLESEDYLLIAECLIRSRRPLLARLALEASAKLDPKNRETAVAQVALASEGEALGIDERKAEIVSTPTNGAALGQLVLGLVEVETEPESQAPFQPMVDRLMERGRVGLAKIETIDDAKKLIARILLEDGRPSEAKRWLKNPADPESHWLASRAALDLDDHAAVDAELAKADGYSNQHLMDYEPCQYVGAKACAKCHAQIYKDQQSSRHAETLVRADALDIVPLPKGPVKDPHDPSTIHEFTRRGKRIDVQTRVGPEIYEAVVAYALGSAHHGQTLVARDAKGDYRSLRISYYTGGDHWDLTSGFEPIPKSSDRFLGEGLTTENYRTCIDCHSTRFRSDDAPVGPEALDHGIGCEKCHGPGENHLKGVEVGLAELAIARPREASAGERMKLCARCHSSDGSIPQSDPKFVRFQSTTLTFSRCFTESAGKLDCVACHAPHTNLETKADSYEARCLACHSTTKPDPKIRLEVATAPPCPVNAKTDCLKCHMPKVEGMLPFTAFTDHHIRVHRPAGAPSASK